MSEVLEWYFCFHPPHRESLWGIFGHVEAFGYTKDDAWVFVDPDREGLGVRVAHLHDEVEDLMAGRFHPSATVLRISAQSKTRFPPLLPMTCVSVCAHLVGLRASTPWGLRRKLLRNGAEIVYAGTERRS